MENYYEIRNCFFAYKCSTNWGELEDTGKEGRETIGKQAVEERTGAEQRQKFSEADEARDNAQARGAYKY